MFVKQIELNEALKLAAEGKEVKVLVPAGPELGWRSYTPDTLRDMLEGCLFFRNGEEMAGEEFEAAVQERDLQIRSDALMEKIQRIPQAPKNQPASVWVPVSAGR